ncbi:MAG: lysophospholipid transporter LplT [Comamonadaceae bacterium]|jgi:MFS family permease|nr:lysophospholipid transporter LplT [Comamonadaceae bacterium]
MKRGFYTIMAAQFFSSLADNALFVVAVELLRSAGAAEWQRAALVPMFALFYVLLAPFVGAFADALPKGRVMFLSNAIKVLGCLLMLWGSHPLLAYAIVGLGAAAYSPAKYGILTELLPASQLIKANGWIEGLTITSIILGVLLGGQLVAPHLAGPILAWQLPGIDRPAHAAILALVPVYALAAGFNLRIPRTSTPLQPMPRQLWQLLTDFWRCNLCLWRDKLGQISLATTTLFWGVSGNLRYIVLAWAAAALGYGTTHASALVGVVAIGTAAGAVWASLRMRLNKATRVIPLGIAMGLLVVGMNLIHSIWLAVPFLIVLGGLGGFLVVPMNALLQHRGHNLMGSGRSIAVQNFNEQAAILSMGGFYSLSTRLGLSAFGAIGVFGLLVASVMWLIGLWLAHNTRRHRKEMGRLLAIARRDHH